MQNSIFIPEWYLNGNPFKYHIFWKALQVVCIVIQMLIPYCKFAVTAILILIPANVLPKIHYFTETEWRAYASVHKATIFFSKKGLSLVRRQDITRTDGCILFIGQLEKMSVKFASKYKHLQSRKYILNVLQNGGHGFSASVY